MEASGGEGLVVEGEAPEPRPEPGPELRPEPGPGPRDASRQASPGAPTRRSTTSWSSLPIDWTERMQDVVSAAVGIVLVLLAAEILVASVVDFLTQEHRLGLTHDATNFINNILLVLILVEIVHTVMLSLRAHALAAEPFLVVGLVAVIRNILFALGSHERLSVSTLGLYIGMVAVFVASLVALELLARRKAAPGDRPPGGRSPGDGVI